MAAIDFPSSPVTGQTYFSNGYGWSYNGTSWVPIAANSSFASVTGGTIDGGSATVSTASLTNSTTSTGITPVWYGGTGLSNVPAGQIVVGNGTSALSPVTLTAGAGISIVKSATSITISTALAVVSLGQTFYMANR